MSHEATNWAIRQRGIKPAAKIVLWHLADRFHPDQGCFPSLETLADDCEMSRRSVQNQLADLEKAGLIRVEKMPRKAGQLPRNRYRFPFEFETDGEPWAKFALGKMEQPPWANSCNHLGQNLPPNSVKGTSKGTSKKDARAREAEETRTILCEVAGAEAVDDYLDHRKAKRAKVTPRAARLIAKKLEGCQDADAALRLSVANGWTGVFPEAVGRSSNGGNHGQRHETGAERAERIGAEYERRKRELGGGSDRDPSQPLLPAWRAD